MKTKKKNINKNKNKNKININVSSAGSSVVPYQQQYKPQNQDMLKFFPTNHTLNVNHSFTPTDRQFNLNSLLRTVASDRDDNRSVISVGNPEDEYIQPIKRAEENIATFNKKVQPEGLAGILYPEEQLLKKQKDLFDLYKNAEVEALNVKKVGRGRPRADLIRLDADSNVIPPKPPKK
jgi:hypothetical protein